MASIRLVGSHERERLSLIDASHCDLRDGAVAADTAFRSRTEWQILYMILESHYEITISYTEAIDMLSPEMMDAKLDEHFGFEARDDLAGVLSTLTDDVEHDIVGWPLGPSRGPAQARAFYESLFADLQDGAVRSVRRLYGEQFLVDESIWTGTAVGNPFGFEGRGRSLSFRLLHVLEFAEDGRISRENVWVDSAAIAQQLA